MASIPVAVNDTAHNAVQVSVTAGYYQIGAYRRLMCMSQFQRITICYAERQNTETQNTKKYKSPKMLLY